MIPCGAAHGLELADIERNIVGIELCKEDEKAVHEVACVIEMKLIDNVSPADEPRCGEIIKSPDALHGHYVILVNLAYGLVEAVVDGDRDKVVLLKI